MTESALGLGLIELEAEEPIEAPEVILPVEDEPPAEQGYGKSAS